MVFLALFVCLPFSFGQVYFASMSSSTAFPVAPRAVGEYGLTEESNEGSERCWGVNFWELRKRVGLVCAAVCRGGRVITLGLPVSLHVCVSKQMQGSVKSNSKWSSHKERLSERKLSSADGNGDQDSITHTKPGVSFLI